MRMLLVFEKGERIRHLGLLDLQRTMQRALRRSGLPVAYSNGFNPHIIMAFASALASGIPGEAELLDVQLSEVVSEEDCLSAMKKALPPALPPIRVRIVDNSFPKCGRLLMRASYCFLYSSEQAEAVISAIPGFLARESIPALRKSKTKETLVDIRPMIHRLTGELLPDGTGVMEATVSFTEEETLKPDLLMEELMKQAGNAQGRMRTIRTGLLTVYNGHEIPIVDYPWPL